MLSRLLLPFILVLLMAAPVLGERPDSAYRAGQRAERKNDLDTAFFAFKRAHDASPLDPRFMAAFLRLRSYASAKHIQIGQELLDEQKFQDALAEFRIATGIDPTNFEALGLIRRTTDEIQIAARSKADASHTRGVESALERAASSAAGPVTLVFKRDSPISIQMTANTDVIYKTLARLSGLNILMDPDYKPKIITFELSNVTVHDALDMLALQSETFWRPLAPNTILVAADSSAKRKAFQQSVMKTFYLRNASTPSDMQQAASALKSILDITHIETSPELRSLTLRCTPDQMVLAQRLLGTIDKPKPEILIDVVVMEVTRTRLSTLGSVLPTTASASIAPQGSSSNGGSSSLTLNSFHSLGAGDVSVSISGASFTALASDSNTKVIQRPEIRVIDSEKASLRIGDRIPIATGTFQSGLTQGVNTQFQYIDVGVNIDITPYVHSDNEVTLKTSLEVSSVTGEQSIDGVTEPTIGQRRIEHEARLADGEVNLIGGILEDSETKSLSGYPGILNIPILKYLFGQENKERAQTEIVFAIVPHVIRSSEVRDSDSLMVDLGTDTSIKYRLGDPQNSIVPPTPVVTNPEPAKPTNAPELTRRTK